MIAQAVCNMGKVGQGQRVGRVETCNGYFQGNRQRGCPQDVSLVSLGAC